MSTQVKIDEVLDCKGLSCPLPILKTKQTVDKMVVGQVLEMIATDPGSVRDMDSWSRRTGHEIMETRHADGLYRYIIRKSA